jgi:hypothetical protein
MGQACADGKGKLATSRHRADSGGETVKNVRRHSLDRLHTSMNKPKKKSRDSSFRRHALRPEGKRPDTRRLKEICLDTLHLEGRCPGTHHPDGICRGSRRPEATCLDTLHLEGICPGAHRPDEICRDTLRLENICLDTRRLDNTHYVQKANALALVV